MVAWWSPSPPQSQRLYICIWDPDTSEAVDGQRRDKTHPLLASELESEPIPAAMTDALFWIGELVKFEIGAETCTCLEISNLALY